MAGIDDLIAYMSGSLNNARVKVICTPEAPQLNQQVLITIQGEPASVMLDGVPLDVSSQGYSLHLGEYRPYVVSLYNQRGKQIGEKRITPQIILPELELNAPRKVDFSQSEFEVLVNTRNVVQQHLAYRIENGPLNEILPDERGRYFIPIERIEPYQLEVIAYVCSEHAQISEDARLECRKAVKIVTPKPIINIPNGTHFYVNQNVVVRLQAQWLSDLSIQCLTTGEHLYFNDHAWIREQANITIPLRCLHPGKQEWELTYRKLDGRTVKQTVSFEFESREARAFIHHDFVNSTLTIRTQGLSQVELCFPTRGRVYQLSSAGYEPEHGGNKSGADGQVGQQAEQVCKQFTIRPRINSLQGYLRGITDIGQLFTQEVTIPATARRRLGGS